MLDFTLFMVRIATGTVQAAQRQWSGNASEADATGEAVAPFATIQAAADVACDGDTIFEVPNVFPWNVSLTQLRCCAKSRRPVRKSQSQWQNRSSLTEDNPDILWVIDGNTLNWITFRP